MRYKFIPLLFVMAFFSACSSPVTPQEAIISEITATATVAINTPIPTNTPMPEPVTLPVDRFTSIPPLAPITLENAAGIKEVAEFDDSKTSAFITDDGSKLVMQFASGVQTYNLPDVSPASFTPLKLSLFTRTNAISADGKYVARSYQAADHPLHHILSIWDTETAKKICEIDSLGRATDQVNINFYPSQNTFSLSGRLAASSAGDKGEVIFWKMDNCQKFLDVTSDAFFAPPISPDGKYTAVVKDGQTAVYDVTTKSQKMIGETKDVRGIGFIPESGKVIISYRGRTLVYDIASGENTATFDTSLGDYYATISSINSGEWIIVKGYEKNYFWNSAENKTHVIGEFLGKDFKFQNGILSTSKSIFNLKTGSKISLAQYGSQPDTALSPDGNYLAISLNAPPFMTDIYETGTGKKITSLPDVHSPITAKDGTFIASGSGKTHFFDFMSGELVKSVDGEYVAGIANGDQQVIVWNGLGEISALDLNSGGMTKKSDMPVFPLGAIQYMQYPNSLSAWNDSVSGGFDNILSALGGDFSYDALAVSGDRTVAIQEGANQLIQIYHGADGVLIPTSNQTLASYENNPFLSLFKFSPDNSVIAGASNQLMLWDGKTGEQIKRLGLSIGATTDMKFSPDGTKLILSGNDGPPQVNVFGNLTLAVFDINEKKFIQQYTLKQSLRKTGCNVTLPFALTADGSQIFTLTQDCRIGLYDLHTFDEVKSFGSPYSDYALSFGLSPDGSMLAVALEKYFELWDVSSGKMIKKINIPELAGNYDNYFHRVVFSPDGKAIVIKSGVSFSLNSTTTVWGVPEIP